MSTIELRIGAFSKIRAWSGELPELIMAPGPRLEQRAPAPPASEVGVRRVGVEIYKPQGARAIYALLGAEWKPGTGDDLLIVVQTSGHAGALIPWAAAAAVDEVRAGLSEEHGRAILACACRDAPSALGGGEVRFDWGREGAVGSNVRVFEAATRAVLRLLKQDPAEVDEAAIANLFADLV